MNKTISSAAIVGAGALGLLYAAPLQKALGDDFYFLAEVPRFSKLKESCFVINGRPVTFNVKTPKQAAPAPPDLVLIAVKNYHLEDILLSLKPLIHPGTILISVLNGIDSEEFLKAHFPGASILYTVALGMDAVKEENELRYTKAGKLFIGDENNDRKNPDLQTTVGFLNSSGITSEIPDDIIRSLWWKWMINIGVNQLSAITGAPYGFFQKNRDIRELMDTVMKETVAVARASNVNLSEKDIEAWYKVLETLGPEGKTSMLQDMEAQRISEAPYFSGRLIQIGKEKGVPVPVNETLFHIIRAKEALFN